MDSNAARWLVPCLLGWVLGTSLQLRQEDLLPSSVNALQALASLAVLWILARRPWSPFASVVWVVLAAASLAFSVTAWRADRFLNTELRPDLEGADLVVVGVIAAMPQVNESATRFRLDVENARLGPSAVQLPPRIYLSWYAAPLSAGVDEPDRPGQVPALFAGDRWQFSVRLKAPHGGLNPHGFDFELWLWEQGLQATGYVRTGAKDVLAQRIGNGFAHPIERLRQNTRDAIVQRLGSGGSGGVVAALVTGDQNAIDRADWDVFRATGVAHLMSISGLHVTMFAWLAVAVVGWLWRRSPALCLLLPAPAVASLGGLLLALAYALFSGWGVPSQRTLIMLAVMTWLQLSARRWPWACVWLLACAAVVLVDPWALTQAGFWLSFVAVGILFASDRSTPAAPVTGWNRRLRALVREQSIITLALAPLTLLLFAQVSLVGLVANMFAIPWVTLVITPLSMLGCVFAPSWDAAALAMRWLGVFLHWMALWPYATVNVAQAPLAFGMVAVLGGLVLVLRLPWQLRLLGLPLLLPVLFWQSPRPTDGQFDVVALDVGQGTAVLVQTANHTLLYDAGPRFSRESDAGHRVLVPLLRALNLRLDTLVLSHRDADHTGGADAVLAMQPTAVLLSSIEDEHPLQTRRKSTRCVAGFGWQWDGVTFEFLHPSPADYDNSNKSNAMSCVLKVANAKHAALLTGDIERAQETRLVQSSPNLHVDLLLVPHHGSKTSSTESFLDAVQPKFAIIQNGYRNRFGHPATAVQDRYVQRGIEVLDSPHCGAATWHSATPDSVQCERAVRQRYWHHRAP